MKHDDESFHREQWPALLADICRLRAALTELSISLKDLLFEAEQLQQHLRSNDMARSLIQRASRRHAVGAEHPAHD